MLLPASPRFERSRWSDWPAATACAEHRHMSPLLLDAVRRHNARTFSCARVAACCFDGRNGEKKKKKAVAGGCSKSRGLQLQTSATRLPADVIDFRTYSKLTARRSNTELNRGFSIVIGIAPGTHLILWAYVRKGGTEGGFCPHNFAQRPFGDGLKPNSRHRRSLFWLFCD